MTTSFSVPVPSSPQSSGSGSGQGGGLGQRRSSASAIIISAPSSSSTTTSPNLTAAAPAVTSGPIISAPLPLHPSAALSSLNSSSSSAHHPASFSAHLLHKPGVILTSIRSTLHIVDSLRHYFKHHAALQQTIARQLHDHTSAEYGRVHGGSGSGVLSALLSFYDKMNAVGQAHALLGQDVTERCCVPLSRCAELGKSMVEVSEKEWKKMQQAMEQTTHAMHKDKEAARAAVASLQKEREKEREAARMDAGDPANHSSAASTSQLSSLKSAFSQLQRRVVTGGPAASAADGSGRHQLALDTARRKALRMCEAYAKALDASNSLQQRVWKQTLPALIKDLQAQQEMNLTTITNALHTFHQLSDAFHSRTAALNADVSHTLATVSVEADIRLFVEQTVDEFGLPVLPPPLTYDLPVTPASLRKEEQERLMETHSLIASTSGTATTTASSTLFKNTLEGCLRHDRLSSPPSGPLFGVVSRAGVLDVPMVVPCLIVAIVHQGGLDSEGIFRLSASSDTVAATRARLEAHDYSVLEALDSPHTPAALLKGFLRDLTEPLIPTPLYDRCIDMGRGLMVGERGDDKRAELSDLLASVPLLHRRVLFHLLSFLAVVSSPAHASFNRMTKANLSIVFAPSLLRSTNPDPVLMLAESKFATQFALFVMEKFEEGGGKEEGGDWKDEWEWSGREEAGCGGYPWVEQDRGAGGRRSEGEGGEVERGKEEGVGLGKEEEKGEKEAVDDDGGAGLGPAAGVEATSDAVGGELPSGWQVVVDDKSGLPFYRHRLTNEVTWVKPVAY